MSWNYRIFKHQYEPVLKRIRPRYFYEIHEVYYCDKGDKVVAKDKRGNKIWAWTEDSIKPVGDTVDELISTLEYILADARRAKGDILDYEKLEAKCKLATKTAIS